MDKEENVRDRLEDVLKTWDNKQKVENGRKWSHLRDLLLYLNKRAIVRDIVTEDLFSIR